jgi:hypothetical protein
MYTRPFEIDRIEHDCLRISDADGAVFLEDIFNHQLDDDDHPIVAQDRAIWVAKMNWVLDALNSPFVPDFPNVT